MTVVMDANFSLAQVLTLPYSPAVIQRMQAWHKEVSFLGQTISVEKKV